MSSDVSGGSSGKESGWKCCKFKLVQKIFGEKESGTVVFAFLARLPLVYDFAVKLFNLKHWKTEKSDFDC